MNDFWQQLIISLMGNAVLVGLIGYLGKIYLDRIARNEQAGIDERLQKLEQDHQTLMTKDEHFHQISQATYQKLFDKKIEVYNTLSIMLHSYYVIESEKYIFNNPKLNCFKKLEEFVKICEFISKNSLYVSQNLNRANYNWYFSYISMITEFNNKEILFLPMEEAYGEIGKRRREEKLSEYYLETKNDIEHITNQLTQDINQIVRYINQS